MSINMIVPTDKNRYAVRPADWAIDIEDGKVSENIRHTAIFSNHSDAEWFILNKQLEEKGLLLQLPDELKDVSVEAIRYAIMYSLCLVKYGVALTPDTLQSATCLSAQLGQAYQHGRADERKIYEEMMKGHNNEY